MGEEVEEEVGEEVAPSVSPYKYWGDPVTDSVRTTGVGEGVNPTTHLHVRSDATAKTRRTAIMLVLFPYGRCYSASLRRRVDLERQHPSDLGKK